MKFSIPRHRTGIAFTSFFLLAAVATGVFVGCRGEFGGGDGDPIGGTGGGQTDSFFRAIQVDPEHEDSAGPQFVTSADIDSDGLVDVVSAWNQSQPVQIHFQRRSGNSISFETANIGGNTPVVRVSGLEVADFDGDGAPDVAVMIKETGLNNMGVTCFGGTPNVGYHGLIIIYFGPADPEQTVQSLAWDEVPVESSRLLGLAIDDFAGPPEEEGYTSMAVGDMDNDGDADIVAALNDACTATDPKVLVFTNGGFGPARDGTWSAVAVPDPFDKAPRLVDDQGSFPPARVKSVALGDVDTDGDLDIFATFPDAVSMNVRWYRNPSIDEPDDYHFTSTEWRTGVVGQVAPNSELFPGPFEDLGGSDILQVGDIDNDDLIDVVVRSSGGKIIQWLKGPGIQATTDPVRGLPWRVYTVAEYSERTPEGVGLGDVDNDGQLDVVAAATGALAYFDPTANNVFESWDEQIILDNGTSDDSLTFINSIHVVDLDGDGNNDIIATVDRSGRSGLSGDALVWFQSTLP